MNSITIEDNFNGSMIGTHFVINNIAFLELKKDPITQGYLEKHDYNLHFNFRIKNNCNNPEIVKFFIGCKETDILDQPFLWLWMKREKNNIHTKINIEGKMKVPGKYYFSLLIEPGLTYFSNYIPLSYESILDTIKFLALSTGAIERNIGKSVEGKDINVFRLLNYDRIRK